MRKITTIQSALVFIVCSIGLFACESKKSATNNAFEQVQDSLTAALHIISKTASFNGFAVALVNDRQVLYYNGFGKKGLATQENYDANTLQNIASVSKTLLGIALLKAQELGKLSLDDSIDQYLPFTVRNPLFPNIPITIRQLATHTSSITDTEGYLKNTLLLKDTQNLANNVLLDIAPTRFNAPDAKIPLQQFVMELVAPNGKWYSKELFLPHKPGAIFSYSNTGICLAAMVLEKATGVPYDVFSTQYILKPLQMNASGWNFSSITFSNYSPTYINKQTAYPLYSLNSYPDGGLITSSADMSKYMLELFKGFYGKGTLLKKESYQSYFTPQLSNEQFIDRSTSEYSDEYNMGITMGFGATGNFGHTGGDPGMFSVIWFDQYKKLGRYFIINTDWNNELTGKDQKAIYDLLDHYQTKLDSISRLQK